MILPLLLEEVNCSIKLIDDSKDAALVNQIRLKLKRKNLTINQEEI
jgi:hypothetical protein